VHLVPAALDRGERPGEELLEVGQRGVDVVVDLLTQPLGLGPGLGDDPGASCSADTVISFTETSRACSASPSLMIRSASRRPASMMRSRSSSTAAALRISEGSPERSASSISIISPRSYMKFVRDIGTERASWTRSMISSMLSSGSTGDSLLSSIQPPRPPTDTD